MDQGHLERGQQRGRQLRGRAPAQDERVAVPMQGIDELEPFRVAREPARNLEPDHARRLDLEQARIGDIVPTHFLEGELILPQFVLEELQGIADSTDPQRRARGRRGLECVETLRAVEDRLMVLDKDYPGLSEVDAKLIKLAKELDGRIVTTDFNLNKVAQIQGVEVLNVNDLANALKPVVLPGEGLVVKVVREGKEEDQGVAYLDDGTMVVIEGGRTRLGQEVAVEVTSVLQNPAGKMVFGRLAS